MPNDQHLLASRFPLFLGTYTEESLIGPIRTASEFYNPNEARSFAAAVMEALDQAPGQGLSTYQVLEQHTRGMLEPFEKAVEQLVLAYSPSAQPGVAVQIPDAHGLGVSEMLSLQHRLKFENADGMTFWQLGNHANRVRKFQQLPREQVTAEKLEGLYRDTHSTMASILVSRSLIEGWGVDSSETAPRHVRGSAEDHLETALPEDSATRENLP